MVLVTAQWCRACRQMKATTISGMLSENKFEGFHFANVDFDRQRQLARRLIKNQRIPQMVVLEKRQGRWTARRLVGVHSVASVEAFLRKSRPNGQPAKVAVGR